MANRSTLKNFFKRGLKPTEGQFATLIDSVFNIAEDTLPINKVDSLADALAGKAGVPDGIISGFEVSKVGYDVTIQGGYYRYLGVSHSYLTITHLTVNPTTGGNSRLDYVCANATTGISIVQGVQSTNPATPAIPANSIVLATVLVTPAGADVTAEELANFVTRPEMVAVTGSITALSTTDKTSLVSAINEVKATGDLKADLVAGKVPSSQLPSYVDDVLEYANFAALPVTGEAGKIYIALDTNFEYRWSGSTYTQIVASPGSTDAVPEGSTNKYFTTARVLASLLTGIGFSTATAVLATDSILQAIGKLQAQVTALFARALPSGGTSGQVLSKVDGADYNTVWIDPPSTEVSPVFGTLFYDSLISWDFTVKRNQQLVLFGNANIAISHMQDGEIGLLIVKQDSVGSRTLVINGSVKVAGSTAGEIPLSTTANAEDSLYIVKKGSTYYINVIKNFIAPVVILDSIYLDAFASSIKAGFSTSKLFSTSTNCVRVRRDSDNTEQDFGFVSGVIDTTGITAFISAGNGFITKWYDQSTNAKHAVQAVQANQPKIILSVLNGVPAIRFDGAASFLVTGSFLGTSFDKSFTSISLVKKFSNSFTLHESASGGYYAAGNTTNVLSNSTSMSGGNTLSVPAYQNNNVQALLHTFTYDGSDRKLYVNNALYGTKNSPLSTDKMNMIGSMYFGNLNGSGFWWDGDMFTKIFLNTGLSEANVKIIGRKIGIDYNLIAVPQIMFDGNSLTYGVNSSTGSNAYPGKSYPSQLVQAVGGYPSTFSFINQGQGGANTETLNTNLSASNIFNTNGFASKLIEIFWEGRNSLVGGDTAVQAFAAMTAYLAKYRALGYNKIAVLTCEPTMIVSSNPATNNANGVSTNSYEVQRLLYNQMIKDNVGVYYDYVVPIDEDSRVGVLANITNLTYWDAAGIHMTDTGYQVIAQLVADTLNLMLAD